MNRTSNLGPYGFPSVKWLPFWWPTMYTMPTLDMCGADNSLAPVSFHRTFFIITPRSLSVSYAPNIINRMLTEDFSLPFNNNRNNNLCKHRPNLLSTLVKTLSYALKYRQKSHDISCLNWRLFSKNIQPCMCEVAEAEFKSTFLWYQTCVWWNTKFSCIVFTITVDTIFLKVIRTHSFK